MNISKDVIDFVLEEESTLEKEFAEIDKNAFSNSLKVLDAFIKENVMECDFNGTTGYGYGDIGRDKIERVFARVLGAEDALVRSRFISGTHALTVCLFGILRPNDLMLSICGMPYDTLHEVIGIKENKSSLKAFGVKYDYIDLKDNDFDYDKIEAYLKENTPKMIHIQRSRGYSDRESLTITKHKNQNRLRWRVNYYANKKD